MALIPEYAKIYNTLKREIVSGDFSPGDQIPPEPELCERFGVSRITVRRAIQTLAQEGYVSVKQGIGTQVLDNTVKQDFNGVTSVTETLRKRGYDVAATSMSIETISASNRLAKELQVKEDAALIKVMRVQTADGRPVAIMKNYLIPSLVEGLENYTDKFTSLYEFLEKHFEVSINSAKDEIYACSADNCQAGLLNAPVDTPLLCIRRVCYSDGMPVAVDVVYALGDIYRIELDLHGRN